MRSRVPAGADALHVTCNATLKYPFHTFSHTTRQFLRPQCRHRTELPLSPAMLRLGPQLALLVHRSFHLPAQANRLRPARTACRYNDVSRFREGLDSRLHLCTKAAKSDTQQRLLTRCLQRSRRCSRRRDLETTPAGKA